MKVEIMIVPEERETRAVIYASEMTEEVSRVAAALSEVSSVITASENGRFSVLKPCDIYMIRSEDDKTAVYCKQKRLTCSKRLYELETALGSGFMRISKSVLVNLSYLESFEPSFNGLMLLILKNGSRDYVSRKYLPALKRYLGI